MSDRVFLDANNDVPILLAAVDGRATHLFTGDKDHFGRYYGLSIEGVLILRPASYMVIAVEIEW